MVTNVTLFAILVLFGTYNQNGEKMTGALWANQIAPS
jgi:hypothetical protein